MLLPPPQHLLLLFLPTPLPLPLPPMPTLLPLPPPTLLLLPQDPIIEQYADLNAAIDTAITAVVATTAATAAISNAATSNANHDTTTVPVIPHNAFVGVAALTAAAEDRPAKKVLEQPMWRERKVCTVQEAEKSLSKLTKILNDLDEIQPNPDQVWNAHEVGMDPNGNGHRIVCTYKWFGMDKI